MGMNREPQKRRIPTSEELESKGAISPATGRSPGERRGFLSRFHRARRFRVSADVAARKHIGVPPRQPSITEPSVPPPVSELPEPLDQLSTTLKTAQQAPGQPRRRAIRIDDTVRQQRGLGNRGG
jgi:hypothetical protein